MSAPKDGGPAFPVARYFRDGSVAEPEGADKGMTLREYAAIHLRVPSSGIEWLDDMIRESQRDEIAAKAMQGMISGDHEYSDEVLCRYSYQVADAMPAAREVKP